MPLQGFSNGNLPLIGATWLNKVDVLMFTVFNEASTPALARTALGATTFGTSIFTAADITAAQTAMGISTFMATVLDDTSAANARTTLGAAALAGLATQSWAALSITLAAGTTTVAPVNMVAGTLLTTPAVGAWEFDGKAYYATSVASNRAVVPITHFVCPTSDFTGTDVATAQPVFTSAIDSFALAASTSYFVEFQYLVSRAAGTTSHTLGLSFGGTATYTNVTIAIQSTSSTGNVLTAPSCLLMVAATTTVVTAASTSATENNIVRGTGIIRSNAAGTLIPQIIFSAAPGGVPTFKAGSFFKLTPVGTDAVTNVGNWS